MNQLPKESLSGGSSARLKSDADRLLRVRASEKAKEAGMSYTALLRAFLRGYLNGKIEVEVPRVLVNEPEVKVQ